MREKQEPPFSIQVELTEGCNLFCKFCGIRGIREKAGRYKFMSLEHSKNIARQIRKVKWGSRIEFAMHGEPTLNPRHLEIIKAFRFYLPQNQLTILTNGVGLLPSPKEKVQKLFSNGINIIGIDNYKNNPFSKKIKSEVKGEEYPGCDSPHKKFRITTKKVIYIKDIQDAESGGHSVLNNHCGCAFPQLLSPIKKRCAKPFRELSIRWDGKIAICCNDWRGHYYCGEVKEGSCLESIWNSREFNIARKLLYHRNRNFIPCKWCDATSYRVGLLPDKMGKTTLPIPTKKEIKWMQEEHTFDKTMSNVVKRPWEKNKRVGIREMV